MEAKELRIGNYVYQDGEFIKGISSNSIHKFHLGQIILEPIPLTEETFLEFGLKQDIDEFWHLTADVLIYKHSTGCFSAYAYDLGKLVISFGNKIEHLHQLQNIYFALTQTDLLLNKSVTE